MAGWLLIPGTLCTKQVFNPLRSALAGLGAPLQVCGSPICWQDCAQATAAVVEGTDGDFSVLSFSLGNFVALELALRHPDRCRGLVMIGATGRADRPENAAGRAAQLEKADRCGRGEMVRQDLLPAYFSGQQEAGAAMAHYVAQMAKETPQADFAAQTQLAIGRPDYLARTAGIRAPALVLNGSGDRATPPDRGRELAESLANGECRDIGGAGHFALLEHPKKCARAIADWTKRESL